LTAREEEDVPPLPDSGNEDITFQECHAFDINDPPNRVGNFTILPAKNRSHSTSSSQASDLLTLLEREDRPPSTASTNDSFESLSFIARSPVFTPNATEMQWLSSDEVIDDAPPLPATSDIVQDELFHHLLPDEGLSNAHPSTRCEQSSSSPAFTDYHLPDTAQQTACKLKHDDADNETMSQPVSGMNDALLSNASSSDISDAHHLLQHTWERSVNVTPSSEGDILDMWKSSDSNPNAWTDSQAWDVDLGNVSGDDESMFQDDQL
jgi:hypothetical protein